MKYWAKYICPDPEEEEDEEEKEHFLIGKAGHCLVNEPHRFDESFVEMPGGIDKRTKVGKNFWQEFQEQNKNASILRPKAYRVAVRCGEAILESTYGRLIASGKGISEFSIRWKDEVIDEETGEVYEIERKARPDWFMPPCDAFPFGLIVDLKFVKDSTPEGFEKEAEKFKYAIQARWYQEALMAFYGTKAFAPFVFVAVEKQYPFVVENYRASPKFLDYGASIIKRRLPEFAKCQATGIWKPASKGATQLLEPNKFNYTKEMSLV